MRQQRRRDTRPELALRRALHARGLRFRVHADWLPGRPDVVLTRAKIAIFVDGCFWHGCPQHSVTPRANRGFWVEKIATNQERDRRKDAMLTELGWAPLHVWEHEDPAIAVERVVNAWRTRLEQRPGRAHNRPVDDG
jgi:DNA mismatch endonuclease (patch repair protein)